MESFDNSVPLSSFEQGAANDQSFMDFFQQQQQHQDQHHQGIFPAQSFQSQHGGMSPAEQITGQGRNANDGDGLHDNGITAATTIRMSDTGVKNGSMAGYESGNRQGSNFSSSLSQQSGNADYASPSSAFAQSTPPTSAGKDQLNVHTHDSSSVSFDSTHHNLSRSGSSSSLTNGPITAQQNDQSATSSSNFDMAQVTSHHQLHPQMRTPIRHQSLPYDQAQHLQENSTPRYAPSSSTRQMSTSALGNGQGLHRSEGNNAGVPAMSLSSSHDDRSSPASSDRLNANTAMNQSPSPLRTSVPFSASPDNSAIVTSPSTIKAEEERGGQVVPSQGGPYGQGHGGQAMSGSGSMHQSDQGAASTKFVHKLFRMVSDPEYQHLISWNSNGTSVVVTNFDEFAKEVLGKHFKHSNFSSFIRQLNMYGFYKVNKTPRGHRHSVDTQVWEFSHPKFLRGRPDLLDEIRRKALDSEHARVEARDLQYSVSVSHMQLRQQVDEQQFRLEEMFELNMAMRQHLLGLRDTLGSVLDWIKNNHGGQLPFDNRAMVDLPPTPVFHPFMAEHPPPTWPHSPNTAGPGGAPMFASQGGDLSGDGPSIYVTEPSLLPPHNSQPQSDVFSMGGLGSVSPFAPGSRRVSSGSQASERMDMRQFRNDGNRPGAPRMTIDTSIAGNPGLGVMGLSGEVQMAINTPLPPSPNVAISPHQGSGPPSAPYGIENSPFLASPSMATFQQQQHHAANNGGYFMSPGSGNGGMPHHALQHNSGSAISDEDTSAMLMGPNAKAMRTPLKRTASNSGQSMQMPSPSQMDPLAASVQKRKMPGT